MKVTECCSAETKLAAVAKSARVARAILLNMVKDIERFDELRGELYLSLPVLFIGQSCEFKAVIGDYVQLRVGAER